MNAPYDQLDIVEPGIARLLAPNPSPFTFTGTQTYLVGEGELVVIDPGPDEPAHIDAMIAAIAGRPVAAIACTHTHRDHSPASRALKEVTGAPIVGCAPLALTAIGPRADASFDLDYVPDLVMADGDELNFDGGLTLTAVATPGHTSNHLCFAYGDALFTGDHVMGWSTSVVVPPDGDMGDYLASLDKLRSRDDRIYFPTHGPPVTKPQQLVRGMIGHRMQREKQILKRLAAGDREIDEIVANCYPGLDPRLVPAAGGSVLAHLMDLNRRGMVSRDGDQWLTN
ncbi:MBL fold metallo-hydrolase [Sphingomonas sp. LY160]|uniref:MBL fold metallo-hydrolase n=1 Tax=Sphingomonas sp. LY160 TaxID=3095342 RepID=UPI002ADEB9ED|nr:MBL fold metallo-hydrolase [Sphingomonas sp. LY160]MEA1073087.1 MBL fold metallo-hydrolase [Sphingomonas sp. LY160]